MLKRNTFFSSLIFLAFILQSCGTTNTSAVLGGAALGNSLGGAIGGLIGDNRHGWRGSYRGSAIGSIVGTIAGATISNALTAPRHEKQKHTDDLYQEEHTWENALPTTSPSSQTTFNNLRIRRIRFIDDNHNHIIDAGESGKVIFEIMNEGDTPVYDVIPSITEISGNKHIEISPSIMVEEILPHNGIKYTATISAGKRLRDGSVIFRLSVTDSYGQEYDYKEFTLKTKR